ncbi:GntR family transcriptional regulator [Paraburkholderia sp. Ac-20340]|uniref:GntR family transcriptional regulator n=1 Tax=Paraburkholderia sp. Ac-20340 TaxID=2703888 RepID=UPI0019807E44|nr:GntR family transcriptional regulator [Paraburkholderia sp. Ac-20340]MBN3853971.1 GntR family transcriptional regulator [Paraburkholderia sp. Ac-20340]
MPDIEKNVPLGEQAYAAIKKMIIEGELASNQAVPESVLAKRLGISRSPVKAALTRLMEDGFVIGEPWKVPYVAPVSAKYIDDVYQLRKALETQCASQALNRIPSAEIEALAAMLVGILPEIESGNYAPVRDAFRRFEGILLENCDNELLRMMLIKLRDHIERVRFATLSIEEGEFHHREYWILREEVDAMRARDASRLSRILSEHTDAYRQWIVQQWDLVASRLDAESALQQ